VHNRVDFLFRISEHRPDSGNAFIPLAAQIDVVLRPKLLVVDRANARLPQPAEREEITATPQLAGLLRASIERRSNRRITCRKTFHQIVVDFGLAHALAANSVFTTYGFRILLCHNVVGIKRSAATEIRVTTGLAQKVHDRTVATLRCF
jgi:hypothetical protein